MMLRSALRVSLVGALCLPLLVFPSTAQGQHHGGAQGPRGSGRGQGSPNQPENATTPMVLDPQSEAALLTALADEYHAQAFYTAAIARFGELAPFSNLVTAESRHADRIIQLLQRANVTIPADLTPHQTLGVPDTLEATCALGDAAEEANGAMYDGFLEFVTDPALVRIFNQLKTVSRNQHLPALQRCADR